MGRKLIVCCDGTSNSVDGNISNVLKLFRLLVKDDSQIAYYHPGIGTIGATESFTELRQKAWSVIGMAFGYGLNDQILAAYRFLVENWREGDEIYLFGFSRGAYTARALAGMLHVVGLIRPEQLPIADFALGAYKATREAMAREQLWDFGRTFGCRRVEIAFVGVWDTVASVIEPHWGRGAPSFLQKLPFTQRNPSIRAFRHALALDERRRMFRPYRWFTASGQDSVERWFAGSHADVGGGYPERESQLAKIALAWLLGEARGAGLVFDQNLYDHLVLGRTTVGATHTYVGPDPLGPIHHSLAGAWWLIEGWPKRVQYREWPKRRSLLGRYIPWGEPRFVHHGQQIDASIAARQQGPVKPPYRPVNLPDA